MSTAIRLSTGPTVPLGSHFAQDSDTDLHNA